MSRIGKRPIAIPQGVNVAYQERLIQLKGPKGEHSFAVPEPDGTLALVSCSLLLADLGKRRRH